MRSSEEVPSVSLVMNGAVGLAARHGLDKTELALQGKGIWSEEVKSPDIARGDILIIAGVGGRSGTAAGILNSMSVSVPEEPESLLIRHTEWNGREALLVCGSDDRGLM